MSETESGSDDIPRPRNEIEIREYERQQLVELLPSVIDVYEEFDSDEMQDRVDDFQTMHQIFSQEMDGEASMYDLGADSWRELAVGLEELDNMRASWLRAKIGRRAELETIHMGFTTRVPFMSLVTGEDPVRPDRE